MSDVEEIALEKACRLCLTTDVTRSSIFAVPGVTVPFVDKIKNHTSVQVTENDKLPTLVCAVCIDKVNQWHTYKEKCIKSQEILQKWLEKENAAIPMVSVKVKSLDEMQRDSNAQKLANDDISIENVENSVEENYTSMEVDDNCNTETDETNTETAEKSEQEQSKSKKLDTDQNGKSNDFSNVKIKAEPIDSEDSVNTGELLLNPLAVPASNDSTNNEKEETAETLQVLKKSYKKKFRRGPHTHYRGIKVFKKKCAHCSVTLHSKHAYTQHMARLHGIVKSLDTKDFAQYSSETISPTTQKSKPLEVLNNVELSQKITDPEELKYEKMIKTEPLTSAQKNLISQLKTFSCYLCDITFDDRVQTVSHVRIHMPDLQPHTCIACSTEFVNKSVYRLHCGASFECAMKIALVVPTIGPEKYFTCNMCLLNLENRKNLLSHLAGHANNQYMQIMNTSNTSTPKAQNASPSKSESSPLSKRSISNNFHGPYMNGSPLHNHMCNLCGMIYRYKPNLIKHQEICKTVPESNRTSYRCVHCSMTFLVFKKFHTHIHCEHKKREIVCFTCHKRFMLADEYLAHHETHRIKRSPSEQEELNNEDSQDSINETDAANDSLAHSEDNKKGFPCTLCGKICSTKPELSSHLSSHLKVKIYSCVLCQTKFSSSGDLEHHMKSHGIHDDTNDKNNDSSDMEYSQNDNSMMNNSAMLNSSVKFHHCYDCSKNFSNAANLSRHKRNLHSGKRRMWQCHCCRSRFTSAVEYNEHVKAQTCSKKSTSSSNATNNSTSQGQLLISPATGKPMMRCLGCPRTFSYVANLLQHCQSVHKQTVTNLDQIPLVTVQTNTIQTAQRRSAPAIPVNQGYACDLCDKSFREEQSLKTHRGWHMRANNRLPMKIRTTTGFVNAIPTPAPSTTTATKPVVHTNTDVNTSQATPKPAKARKSFANNPSQKQLNVIANAAAASTKLVQPKTEMNSWQCQVCDNRYSTVNELRNHVWEVHCSGNKIEKKASNEFKCNNCSMTFSDNESLQKHMLSHEQNPVSIEQVSNDVISPKRNFQCDKCGKHYTNRKVFLRHKKMHKVLPVSSTMNLQSLLSKRPYCIPCRKPFATDASLRRHKIAYCHQPTGKSMSTTGNSKKTAANNDLLYQALEPLVQVKTEPGVDITPVNYLKKKPVTCHICETTFPNKSVLYQHKQLVHSSQPKEYPMPLQADKQEDYQEMEPLVNAHGQVCCNVCGKEFPGLANLKLHFAHKHKNKPMSYPCHAPGCKLSFNSIGALKLHEPMHSNIMFTCLLCPRHVFSKTLIIRHLVTEHNVSHQAGSSKNWSETNLSTYTVKNSQGTICPKCKVKYPNLRALKIHYLKFHEKVAVKS